MAIAPDVVLTTFLRFFSGLDKAGKPVPWLKERERIEALVEAILESPLFASIAGGSFDGGPFAAVAPGKLAKKIASGKEVIARLQDQASNRTLLVGLDLYPERAEVRLMVTGPALAANAAGAIDELIAVAKRCVAALRGAAGLSDGYVQADYQGSSLDYPRPRPPREAPRYPARSIVTLLDPAFHATPARFAKPEQLKALLTPAPPAPAKMTKDDGLVVVRWTSTLDDAALKAGASAHAQWVADRLAPDIVDGFNEHGDQRDARAEGSKGRGKLTFYDAESEVGYKAVLVLPDGTPEERGWKEATKVAKAGALPDGTPVAAVRVIVPLRHHAFEIAAQARAAGIDGVLYPDDDGDLWNPDPPGAWRTPPIQLEAPKSAKTSDKSTKAKPKGK